MVRSLMAGAVSTALADTTRHRRPVAPRTTPPTNPLRRLIAAR